MINKHDLLARLQKGETVEDIAKEITDTLNRAKKEYDAIQQKDKEKDFRVSPVRHALIDYYENDQKMKELIRDISTDDFADLLDSLVDLRKSVEGLHTLEFEGLPYQFLRKLFQ